MYAAYLARRMKANSVRQYLNIVRLLHLECGYPNPCENNWQLRSTLSGIARTLGTNVTRKTPITPDLLLSIYGILNHRNILDLNFWAASLIMFFGMFRKSNLLPNSTTSFSPNKQFTRGDFWLHPSCVSVLVKYTKTIQHKQRSFTVKFPLLRTSLCPVTALMSAFRASDLPSDAPAFVSDSSGTPLHSALFIRRLKEAVRACGKDPKLYASHSFRRGSATWALSCGVPGELVKSMGDWKSTVYLDYLDDLPDRVWYDYMRQFSASLPQ